MSAEGSVHDLDRAKHKKKNTKRLRGTSSHVARNYEQKSTVLILRTSRGAGELLLEDDQAATGEVLSAASRRTALSKSGMRSQRKRRPRGHQNRPDLELLRDIPPNPRTTERR